MQKLNFQSFQQYIHLLESFTLHHFGIHCPVLLCSQAFVSFHHISIDVRGWRQGFVCSVLQLLLLKVVGITVGSCFQTVCKKPSRYPPQSIKPILKIDQISLTYLKLSIVSYLRCLQIIHDCHTRFYI